MDHQRPPTNRTLMADMTLSVLTQDPVPQDIQVLAPATSPAPRSRNRMPIPEEATTQDTHNLARTPQLIPDTLLPVGTQ